MADKGYTYPTQNAGYYPVQPSAPSAAYGQMMNQQGYPTSAPPAYPVGAAPPPSGHAPPPSGPPPPYTASYAPPPAQYAYPPAGQMYQNQYAAPPQPMYPTQQPQVVMASGAFDSGARFDGVAQPRIPPPPPGYAPNHAQMAAMQGNTVVATQRKGNWFEGSDGGGYTFF